MNEEEKNIKMFKRYINSLEQRLEDYYRIDEEFYKDNIEDLELNIKLARYILSLISKLQKELDKKDKVIDLMAKELLKDDFEYEDACKYCEHNNEDCHGDYCAEARIKYFYKQVEVKDE